MSATAHSKKTDTVKLGHEWAVSVEVKADTKAASPVEAPVEVEFVNPDGQHYYVAGVHQGKGVHTAALVLNVPGAWTAVAHVDGPNADDVDGFTATASK